MLMPMRKFCELIKKKLLLKTMSRTERSLFSQPASWLLICLGIVLTAYATRDSQPTGADQATVPIQTGGSTEAPFAPTGFPPVESTSSTSQCFDTNLKRVPFDVDYGDASSGGPWRCVFYQKDDMGNTYETFRDGSGQRWYVLLDAQGNLLRAAKGEIMIGPNGKPFIQAAATAPSQ